MAAAKDLGLRGEQAAEVRKRVGEVSRKALTKLAEELELYKPQPTKRSRGGRHNYAVEDAVQNHVPADWVDRFAKIADQIRRDYVIDESADDASEAPPTNQPPDAQPLKRLKVV